MSKLLLILLLGAFVVGSSFEKPVAVRAGHTEQFKAFLPGVYKKTPKIPYLYPIQILERTNPQLAAVGYCSMPANLMWFYWDDNDPDYWENIQSYCVGSDCNGCDEAQRWVSMTGYGFYPCSDCGWAAPYNDLHVHEIGITSWYDTSPDEYILTNWTP